MHMELPYVVSLHYRSHRAQVEAQFKGRGVWDEAEKLGAGGAVQLMRSSGAGVS